MAVESAQRCLVKTVQFRFFSRVARTVLFLLDENEQLLKRGDSLQEKNSDRHVHERSERKELNTFEQCFRYFFNGSFPIGAIKTHRFDLCLQRSVLK